MQRARRSRRWRITLDIPGRMVWPLLAGLLAVGFLAVERFPEKTGPLAALSALRTVSGPVTKVRDGDTIEVSGTPIRFGSLDCAERGTWQGQQASNRMRMLVRGQRLTCALNGRRSYDRHIGSCTLPDGRDLAAIMIRSGLCRRFY